MCLPTRSDGPGARSLIGLGAVMLAACIGGPALAGVVGAGALLVVAVCLAPAALAAAGHRWRQRRSANA